MTSGVSPIDRIKESSRTEFKIDLFNKRADFILQNQGPTVLPLAGHGGSPLKMAPRNNSLHNNSSANLNFAKFRANQYKETLPLKL